MDDYGGLLTESNGRRSMNKMQSSRRLQQIADTSAVALVRRAHNYNFCVMNLAFHSKKML